MNGLIEGLLTAFAGANPVFTQMAAEEAKMRELEERERIEQERMRYAEELRAEAERAKEERMQAAKLAEEQRIVERDKAAMAEAKSSAMFERVRSEGGIIGQALQDAKFDSEEQRAKATDAYQKFLARDTTAGEQATALEDMGRLDLAKTKRAEQKDMDAAARQERVDAANIANTEADNKRADAQAEETARHHKELEKKAAETASRVASEHSLAKKEKEALQNAALEYSMAQLTYKKAPTEDNKYGVEIAAAKYSALLGKAGVQDKEKDEYIAVQDNDDPNKHVALNKRTGIAKEIVVEKPGVYKQAGAYPKPSQAAIDALRKHPEKKDEFIAMFGGMAYEDLFNPKKK